LREVIPLLLQVRAIIWDPFCILPGEAGVDLPPEDHVTGIFRLKAEATWIPRGKPWLPPGSLA